jgi:peptidoglycan/LPS O-acetylase OafA/YrhL
MSIRRGVVNMNLSRAGLVFSRNPSVGTFRSSDTNPGYPWTLNLFAAFSTLWIEREIRFYKAGRKPLLEKLGEATYSIYLTHFSSGAIARTLPIYAAMPSGVAWFWTMLCCGTPAAAFHWLIERPSHRFAWYFTRHSGFSRALPGLGGNPTYAPIPAEVVISTGGRSPS